MSKGLIAKISSPRTSFHLNLSFIVALAFVSMLFAQQVHAAQVTVAWNPDASQVAGYTVYSGLSSRNYTNTLNAGSNTSATLQNLSSQTYFIAVAAYDGNNIESGFSKELVVDCLTASAGAGGTIAPSGSFFQSQGASQTFTITAASGYRVADVKVDGASIGAVTSYTFSNITANHAISATFEAGGAPVTRYTITPSAGANGAISPSKAVMVNSGASQTFTITAASSYRVAAVKVDGASIGAVTSYTFSKVAANHTISATFALAATFTITPAAGANGTISPATPVKVNSGASQTFTITAASGSRVADVQADGVSVGTLTSCTFTNVTANHTISANFETAPFADAGPDQTVAAGAKVTLNGSNSTDAGGPGIASSLWTQIGGTPVVLPNRFAAKTTFIAPYSQEGALTFQLSVKDVNGLQSTEICIVNVISTNVPPTANAGPDLTVNGGQIITLDGSGSSDQDSGTLSYLWQQTDGPEVALFDPGSPQSGFIAPQAGSAAASLRFRLTVTNNYGLKSTDTCFVNVTPADETPKAVAGPAQTVMPGSVVTLDGSSSSVSGSGIASYRWRQARGKPMTLSNPASATPFFTASDAGLYGYPLTFMLIVEDGDGMRSRANQVIDVEKNASQCR